MESYERAGQAPWFEYRSKIKKLIIENGVTSIGKWAFANIGITEVNMPDSVTFINTGAFLECKFEKIALIGVNKIWNQAFNRCEHLKKVTFGENDSLTIMKDAFWGVENLEIHITAKNPPDLSNDIEVESGFTLHVPKESEILYARAFGWNALPQTESAYDKIEKIKEAERKEREKREAAEAKEREKREKEREKQRQADAKERDRQDKERDKRAAADAKADAAAAKAREKEDKEWEKQRQHKYKQSGGYTFCQYCGCETAYSSICYGRVHGHNYVLINGEIKCNKCGVRNQYHAKDNCKG